jgi:hypothetical protein
MDIGARDPTPTSLDPKFQGPLPHMGWGGIIDLVTYGPMGYRRRSWGWRTTWRTSQPMTPMTARVLGLVIVAPFAFCFFYSLASDVSRLMCAHTAGTNQAARSACYQLPEPALDPSEAVYVQLK